jgi:hypothetical protein
MVKWVCSRSQGQPPGARRRAWTATKASKSFPMRLAGDFVGMVAISAICRRADFSPDFWLGFGRFEIFLRLDRGGGTAAFWLLR